MKSLYHELSKKTDARYYRYIVVYSYNTADPMDAREEHIVRADTRDDADNMLLGNGTAPNLNINIKRVDFMGNYDQLPARYAELAQVGPERYYLRDSLDYDIDLLRCQFANNYRFFEFALDFGHSSEYYLVRGRNSMIARNALTNGILTAEQKDNLESIELIEEYDEMPEKYKAFIENGQYRSVI